MCDREIKSTYNLFFTWNEVVRIWNVNAKWLGFVSIHHGATHSTLRVLIKKEKEY